MQTAETIRDANVRYHDLAAEHYDSKWGINYDAVGQAQVTSKLRKALGHEPGRYSRALEIGAGTGYFSLNLLRAGVIGEAVATDISPGMLGKLERSAAELELPVETAACEASELPYEDGSFDLVFGHAVLHHLPNLDAAFREFRRVLRPGGVVAFCGEPSYYGDRIAAWPKRGANAVAPLWRALMRAGPRPYSENGNGGWSEEDRLE
jgi:ubiquinone/menaquinone biosynthesis C-methylase UbiE